MHDAAAQLQLFRDADEPDPRADFSVRESGRARRMSIKVYPRGRVEVVVPRRSRAAEVEAFVAENRDWIRKTRAAFAEEHPPEPFELPQLVELPGVGLRYRVRYEPQRDAKSVRYRANGSTLVLRGRTDDESLCIVALKRWLASVARREFLPLLTALSQRTGEPFSRMHVRGQRTCWGSHSSNGTISLNYCLLFLRPEQVAYVMIHELCHARHMNHSRRYWALVARHEPDYRQLDKGLNSAWKQIPAWVGVY